MRYRIIFFVIFSIVFSGCASVNQKQQKPMDIPVPSPADVNRKLGLEYFKRGQLDVALEKFKLALQADSRNSETHQAIGILYQRLEQTDLAELHLGKAVSYRPSNASAQVDYGNFLCSVGKFADADGHFNQALHTPLYRRPENALLNAGICAHKAGNIEAAEEYLRKALDIKPKLSRALLGMAKVSLAQDKPLSGRAFLQRYSGVARNSPESLQLGIEIEKALGDEHAASQYQSQLKAEFPRSKETKALSD